MSSMHEDEYVFKNIIELIERERAASGSHLPYISLVNSEDNGSQREVLEVDPHTIAELLALQNSMRFVEDNIDYNIVPSSNRSTNCGCNECLFERYSYVMEQCSEVVAYGECCVICTETMIASTRVDSLACGHMFHDACLRKYVYKLIIDGNVPNCPLCRRSLDIGNRVHGCFN